MVELSLAARAEPDLRSIVAEHERVLNGAVHDAAANVFGAEVAGRGKFASRWAMAVSTARGLAMLRLLGHPAEAVEPRWTLARRELPQAAARLSAALRTPGVRRRPSAVRAARA